MRCRSRALPEHGLGDEIGIFEHRLVRCRRADGADDAFADPRKDGLLARAADESIDVGAHRHPRHREKLDAVLGHRGHLRRSDDLGVHADLHRLEYVAPGQVDRRRLLEVERDPRFVGRDQRPYHSVDAPASEIVRFECIDRQDETRLVGIDERVHDVRRVHLPEPHAEPLH
jgi:hypothetical protein